MSPALIESLEALPAIMAEARDPWWVIASAAMALHGAEVSVADIDLLTSERDGRALAGRHGFVPMPDAPSPTFRSALYARRHATPIPIELMADFHIFRAGRWQPLRPATRLWLPAGRARIPIPSTPELIQQCGWYGRPKDRERAAILQRLLG
jgi:hypothetical protein